MLDAERKIVELTPNMRGKKNESPTGDSFFLHRNRMYKLRRAHEDLDDAEYEGHIGSLSTSKLNMIL